jgi:glycosyltransferase involved in cell wall biosynthesis
VDAAQFAPLAPRAKAELRRRLELPEDARVIVFAGRFVAEKRLNDLLTAFARAREEFSDALLILIGDGPLMPAVRRQMEELGLQEAVRLTGFLNSQDVCLRLQAANVFAMTSESEGIPCALIEAMSAALPSAITNIPAMTQLIHEGVEGLWAEVGDAAGFAAVLCALLRDPAGGSRMGAAARETILAGYTVEAVAERYENFFQNLVEDGR